MLSLWDISRGISSTPDHRAIDAGHNFRRKSSFGFGFDTLLELGPILYAENYCGYSIHGQGVPVGQRGGRFTQLSAQISEGCRTPVVGHIRMVFRQLPVKFTGQCSRLDRSDAHDTYATAVCGGGDLPGFGRTPQTASAHQGNLGDW